MAGVIRVVIREKARQPDEEEKELILGEEDEELDLVLDEEEENPWSSDGKCHDLCFMKGQKPARKQNKTIPTEPTRTESSANGKKTPKNKP